MDDHCIEVSEQSSKKRKRVADQIKEGITSNIHTPSNIFLETGSITMKCPSRDNSTIHTVSFSIDNNKFKFECDCSGKIGEIKSGHCIHLNKCLIQICCQFINKSVEFMDFKERHVVLKQMTDELSSLMSNMNMNDRSFI